MPLHVVQRVIWTLGRKDGVARLPAVARAFALPQLCFPKSQPLVVHARAAMVEAERQAEWREAVPVEISGATGPNAAVINGVYERTAERRRERVVYRKRGDGDMWLSMAEKGWMVQETEDKEADNTDGWLTGSRAGALAKAPSPLAVPLEAWDVFVAGRGWTQQAALRVERA